MRLISDWADPDLALRMLVVLGQGLRKRRDEEGQGKGLG
jgi:hypothetical protein